MKTISEIIDVLDDVDNDISEMNQIPIDKINLLRMKINEIVDLLDDMSNTYGDECMHTDADEYDDDDEIEY
jgi:hypothetical protein